MKKINVEKVRIIPKLEIKNNFLIKGVRFEGLKKIGDPVVFAKKYYEDFADQINIIDIVASLYSRDNIYDIIDKITKEIFIPVNVGGGIANIDHIKKLLNVGADRIIVNSAALRNPNFLIDIKNIFGDQFLTVSIEAKKIQSKYYCMMDHGRENSNIEVCDWIKQLNKIGIGEIVLNSIDHDGMRNGFDNCLLNEVYSLVKSPLVISGGAYSLNDFSNTLSKFTLDGLCSSTALHNNALKIADIKKNLKDNNYQINL
jgi:cyclase